MIENGTIRKLIEAAVAESFDEHMRALHDDVVDRVLRAVGPLPASAPASSGSSAKDLNQAVIAIQHVSQQVEILKGLLDGASGFSARTALFILRGNVAVGWQARGFADNDSIKAVMIEAAAGAVGRVVHNYAIEKIPLADFDSKFSQAMGAPVESECALVPLVVRGKVAAFLYADAGDEGVAIDVQALEILSRAAGDWIELQALRKASGAPAHYPIPSYSAHVTEAAPKNPVEAVTPVHAEPPAPEPVKSELERASKPVETVPVVAAPPEPVHPAASESMPEPPAAPVQPAAPPSASAQDEEELHKKARRFAKLLIDEIVLYNQHKVVEGRQHHDLYDRLKEDIEKSRATYDKRYAQTSVSQVDYFTQALISGLADHNPMLLGSNFPR